MKRTSIWFVVSILFSSVSLYEVCAMPIGLSGGGGDYDISTQSIIDKRFAGVTKQKFDFSCGSAALATLLNEFYGHSVDEKEVLMAMYEAGNQEAIQLKGFSLLDMRSYLASIGYTADGYRSPLDKLIKADIPAIALINPNGYSHFVVVAGVSNDSVILLDSTKGKRVARRDDFEKQWNGILFIIHDDMKLAGKSFNTKKQWVSHLQARFNVNLNDRDLASVGMTTAYMPGYY